MQKYNRRIDRPAPHDSDKESRTRGRPVRRFTVTGQEGLTQQGRLAHEGLL